jgi:LysR family hydrogen peroxide-inducible transcriptional activator
LDASLVSLPKQGNLATAALFREPFLLAYPENYRTRDDALLDWEALPDRERLLLDDGHCLRDQALAASPSSAKASRHATSLETLKYMVAAGEGATLIPALARTDVSFIFYKPIADERYSRQIALVWRRSDPRTSHFKELGMFLQKVIINLDYTLQPL